VIIDERMTTYINSLDTENSSFLESLEREAKADQVPIIRREMQSFLKVMLMLKQPTRILEIGTAVGFSALLMCENAPANCHITTIENYQKRIPIAQANFAKADVAERITLLNGDANEILKELKGSFDFIFMDAAKAQYINFLPEILRLMDKGAVLISDNVLQDGDIIESHFAIERRNRTIHKRMREYLYQIKHHDELITSIIPLGDGVTVSIKREME
jgi:Predicted O-methyltransferase